MDLSNRLATAQITLGTGEGLAPTNQGGEGGQQRGGGQRGGKGRGGQQRSGEQREPRDS